MEIKKLDKVDIRDIWKNEASGFTSWLEKNIEILNEILPFSINNIEREQNVGTFSVDLKGVDDNGDLVIIENQLEKSDHDHLGKVITYLSNLDAKTAIWICKEPRPEHLEAVDWLNKYTGFGFYLIKLEAIKIGDSPVAPLFSIVSSPSKEIQEAGEKSKEMSETQNNNLEFWTHLLNKIKSKKISLHSNLSPSNYCYIQTGAGISGLTYVYWITNNSAFIGLYIDKGKDSQDLNKEIFESLSKNKKEIEESFGKRLEWQYTEGTRHCKIIKKYNLGLKNKEDWDTLQEEMITDMVKFEKAISPFVKKIKL